MSIKLAIFKARGLSDRSKAAFLLGNLLSYGIDIGGILETYFTMLMQLYCVTTVVYSAYEDQISSTNSLLVKRIVGVKLDLVDAWGWFILADIAVVSSGSLRCMCPMIRRGVSPNCVVWIIFLMNL